MVEAIAASLDFAARGGDGVAAPVAVLWTDADGQWKPALQALQAAIPHLYVLGSFDPLNRTGPVIWLKCVIERALPEVKLPAEVVPVLYLPGVSRQELRAAGDCPRELLPLIELQYRGAVWHQRNGRDWTIDAFVTSEQGIGLDVGGDPRTREAMHRSLPVLIIEPLPHLRRRRLHADDFDRLSVEDPIRDVLSWMNSPDLFQKMADTTKWSSFRAVCKGKYKFDPESDTPVIVAAGILNGDQAFEELWRRFADTPGLYPNICSVMGQATARDLLARSDRNPLVNDREEATLRAALGAAATKPHHEACSAVIELERQHGVRRKWVWAAVDRAPLAMALESLADLAKRADKAISGSSIADMVQIYAQGGWEVDRAALESLLNVRAAIDVELIGRVVKALYAEWLDQTAHNFQKHVLTKDAEFRSLTKPVEAEQGACVLFADGLRFDVGGMLQEVLEGRGAKVRVGHRVAPLPTVTATGKPWASPAHKLFEGPATTEDFSPIISTSKQPVNAERLRKAMESQGVDVIEGGQVRMASNIAKGGWAEIGEIDSLGHKLNARLVDQIAREIEAIADRVMELLNAGWTRVRIVTDHGWLLLPGDLPKIEMPPSLVVRKGHRSAALKGESSVQLPTYPWHWNPQVVVVSPPGIGVFYADIEYAHGGVTLQECVVPDIIVELGHRDHGAEIVKVDWKGMRCRVSVKTDAKGLVVDLRLKRNDPKSIATEAKSVPESGDVTLIVEDDSHEGSGAVVVVLDPAGKVLHFAATTVGEV
jgi:PglZ domain